MLKIISCLLVVFANIVIAGCAETESINDQTARDARIKEVTENIVYNMDVNKQEAINELAPHLDKLVSSLVDVCSEIDNDRNLLEECNAELADIRSQSNAIKNGDFDSISKH